MDFSRESFTYSNGWHADETYDLEVLAVAEQQYLQPVPIQHITIFYHSAAEPDSDVLKLPIRGYVQTNSASQ